MKVLYYCVLSGEQGTGSPSISKFIYRMRATKHPRTSNTINHVYMCMYIYCNYIYIVITYIYICCIYIYMYTILQYALSESISQVNTRTGSFTCFCLITVAFVICIMLIEALDESDHGKGQLDATQQRHNIGGPRQKHLHLLSGRAAPNCARQWSCWDDGIGLCIVQEPGWWLVIAWLPSTARQVELFVCNIHVSACLSNPPRLTRLDQ